MRRSMMANKHRKIEGIKANLWFVSAVLMSPVLARALYVSSRKHSDFTQGGRSWGRTDGRHVAQDLSVVHTQLNVECGNTLTLFLNYHISPRSQIFMHATHQLSFWSW